MANATMKKAVKNINTANSYIQSTIQTQIEYIFTQSFADRQFKTLENEYFKLSSSMKKYLAK